MRKHWLLRFWNEARGQLDMEGPEVKRVLKDALDETAFWKWKGVATPMHHDDDEEVHWGWLCVGLANEQEDEDEMKHWGIARSVACTYL